MILSMNIHFCIKRKSPTLLEFRISYAMNNYKRKRNGYSCHRDGIKKEKGAAYIHTDYYYEVEIRNEF